MYLPTFISEVDTEVYIQGKHNPLVSSHISIPWVQGGLFPHKHESLNILHVGDQGLFSHDFRVTPHLHNPSRPSQLSLSTAHTTCLHGSIKLCKW